MNVWTETRVAGRELADRYGVDEDTELIFKTVDNHNSAGSINSETHTVTTIITAADVDQDGDILKPDGLNDKPFRRHPIVLFGNRRNELPVGRNEWIKVEGKRVLAKTVYVPGDINPQAERMFQFRKQGYPLAQSIGFVVDEEIRIGREGFSDELDDLEALGWLLEKDRGQVKRVIKKWTLYEFSDVVVPFSPEAVALAVGKGLLTKDEAKAECSNYNCQQQPEVRDCPTCENYRHRLIDGIDYCTKGNAVTAGFKNTPCDKYTPKLAQGKWKPGPTPATIPNLIKAGIDPRKIGRVIQYLKDEHRVGKSANMDNTLTYNFMCIETVFDRIMEYILKQPECWLDALEVGGFIERESCQLKIVKNRVVEGIEILKPMTIGDLIREAAVPNEIVEKFLDAFRARPIDGFAMMFTDDLTKRPWFDQAICWFKEKGELFIALVDLGYFREVEVKRCPNCDGVKKVGRLIRSHPTGKLVFDCVIDCPACKGEETA